MFSKTLNLIFIQTHLIPYLSQSVRRVVRAVVYKLVKLIALQTPKNLRKRFIFRSFESSKVFLKYNFSIVFEFSPIKKKCIEKIKNIF